MKKLLALIVVLMMVAWAACASGIDWGSMTDQQITMAIAEAEAELDGREAIAAPGDDSSNDDFDIIIEGDKPNDYARELVFGKGTEYEYTLIGYFVPKAVYDVTNLSGTTAIQVSVYGENTVIDDGREYPGDVPEQNPVVLMPGEKNQIMVFPGTYIKLSQENSKIGLKIILYLEMQN